MITRTRQRIFIFAILALALCVGSAHAIDGARAMADIKTQVAFGPRVPGTPGHAACRDWIKAELAAAGWTVWEQPFTTELPLAEVKSVEAVNIWGLPASDEELARTTETLIGISAHWDTRPFADRDGAGAKGAFLGANDAGSGVAVALGIARAIKGTPIAQRVVFILVDAEDSGIERQPETYCLGSKFAAGNPPAWFKRVKFGINLDMVGGRDLILRREISSEHAAPEVIARLWKIGRDLAPKIFINEPVGPITDDHVSFIEKGTPWVDLIGWGYPQWHTSLDLPASCDANTMKQVGEVLVEFLKRETR